MSLVSKHTFVPVPNVFFTKFGPDHGHIGMTLIPGSCLGEKWDTLDGKSRKSVCLQIWDLLSMIRAIPRPPKLEVFTLFEDLREPARPLTSDSEFRTRIFERYLHFAVTCILDREFAGWYPDYWECAQIMIPAFRSDFRIYMDRTAPKRWDLSRIIAASKTLPLPLC
ncbi:hypothetical protein BDV29DRAFT_190028 [Aspergillus leporis]|uniref:Uncharacterized protein n=1 Tax=Aspergillus leporis TaxID=41062 RepID=A0A5N5X4H3_9EURO|nr:hypothetical protein BDV29DRAFT_190028 [Aspergillus leporis]